MDTRSNGFILGVVAIAAVFYFLITSHENKIDRMETIINDLHDTMELQDEAIKAQQIQNQWLLQYYYSQQNPTHQRKTYD